MHLRELDAPYMNNPCKVSRAHRYPLVKTWDTADSTAAPNQNATPNRDNDMDTTVQEKKQVIVLEAFAAELALAAYRVALQTRTQGTWLDLELELWKTLADAVRTRGRVLSGPTGGEAACPGQ